MMRGFLIFAFFTISTLLVIVLQPGPRDDFAYQQNPQALLETSRNQMQVLDEPREDTLLTIPDDVISELKAGGTDQSVQPIVAPEAADTGVILNGLQATLATPINTDAAVSDALAEATTVFQQPSVRPQASIHAIAPELRDMSWQTLNALNGIGHVSKAPGQQGSLLNSIVRRSMGHVDGTLVVSAPSSQMRVALSAPAVAINNATVWRQAARAKIAANTGLQNYTVSSGDTLALIAIKLYGSALATDQLLQDNPVLRQNPNTLRIGQQLNYRMP